MFGPRLPSRYVRKSPSVQQTLDLFHGSWSSLLPPPLENMQAGKSALFEDQRIDWGIQTLGGVKGKRVLELGPLEGGHSWMLQKRGAAQVDAVEGNSRAFLKCLVLKELLGMDRVRFLLGDFVSFLRESADHYDICVASGVLYHMENPGEMLALVADHADALLLWTHYFQADTIAKNPMLRKKFAPGEPAEVRGFKHLLYRQKYGAALNLRGFCGGPTHQSNWMFRDDIIKMLQHLGMTNITIAFEDLSHPHGPAICLAACRPNATQQAVPA